MKLLFLETAPDGLLDLALRAGGDHEVRYHVGTYDAVKHPTGRGLVQYVGDWRASMRWCDLVICGSNGKWLHELDRWKMEGVPVIGGCVEAAKLELDRLAGMAAFKKAGIPTPPFRQCMNLDEAIAYVADKGEGFACKPCGDVSDKSLSFVGKTAEETIWRLQRWRRSAKAFPSGLMIQQRISGVEFAVGAWIGPDGFAPGIEENAEFKRFFPRDLGPNTGEMGTVMRLVRSSKLFDKVLKPIEDYAVSLGYCGNLDVNCIIDDEGTVWPLEWTARCGWPSTNIELALHRSDPIEFLAGLAAGDPPNSRVMNQVAVGISLVIPPFPNPGEKHEEVVGVPIWGVTPGIEDNLHWADVCMADAPVVNNGSVGKEPQLSTCGSYVGVSTGTGATIVEARREADRVLQRLTIPAAPYWRWDIGSRLKEQLPKLQKHGYAIGMVYS